MVSGSPWREGVAPGRPSVSAGADSPVHRRLDGALDVGPRPGPRQLLHPVLDCSGGPAWHWAPGTQLPRPLAHWGPRHRCRGLALVTQPFPHPSALSMWIFLLFSYPYPTPHSHLFLRLHFDTKFSLFSMGIFYTLSQVWIARIREGQTD